ncbi:neprilysin, putative, partial [Ixodes scapularis]
STLIQNMNQTVDPCENFYEFACGGWVHRHPIPEDRSSLDEASLGLPDRTYFLKGLNDSVVAAYLKLMTEAAQLLGADKKAAQTELREALQFEIALANIDWDRYFNSLLVDKVTPDEPIIVVVPKFVQQFESLILRTPARTVANYMVWWVVLQSYATLGKPWRERLQEFGSVLTGETREMARWEQCMGSLTGYLGIALSSLYVRHFFQDESKGAALDMVNFIMKEFMSILEDINWMDEQTRQRARAKALAIQPYIGYPEELLKDALVEEHYSNINGVNTQGENIADNGGIKEAFNAYKKWVKQNGPEARLPGLKYTPQQLFWISAANMFNVLCRVIGPTSNSPEFAAEFNCPVGSPMNPVNKCIVW